MVIQCPEKKINLLIYIPLKKIKKGELIIQQTHFNKLDQNGHLIQVSRVDIIYYFNLYLSPFRSSYEKITVEKINANNDHKIFF